MRDIAISYVAIETGVLSIMELDLKITLVMKVKSTVSSYGYCRGADQLCIVGVIVVNS